MALPENFTGTNGTALSTYDALWVSNAAHTGVMEIQSNKASARASPAATSLFVWDQQPASADYTVTAYLTASTITGMIGGIVGRADKTASTFYMVRMNDVNLQVYKFVAGTPTQLGSNVTHGMTAGVAAKFDLVMSGTSIKGYVNDVEKISVTDSAITAIGYGGMRAANSTSLAFDDFNVSNMGGGATATTLSGPSSGTVSVASSNFTVGANGTITGTVTVTPSDAADGGTFTPTSVAISAGTPTATFTYTPASTGSKTISISDDGGLTDATPLSYTSNAASGYAPALFTMRNPSGVHFFGAHR